MAWVTGGVAGSGCDVGLKSAADVAVEFTGVLLASAVEPTTAVWLCLWGCECVCVCPCGYECVERGRGRERHEIESDREI